MNTYLHLPTLQADDPSTWNYAHRCYRKGFARGFFNKERRWLGKLHADKIRSGHTASVRVAFVDEEIGHGLFAATDLPAHTFVGTYTGILRRRPLFAKSNDYCFSYPTGTWSSRPLVIDAQDHGNVIRFINHSKRSNCEAFGVPVDGTVQVLVRTHRNVLTGEQLTMDYGPHFWKEEPANL